MDRHDWCPKALDQFFGPEPMAHDPLPARSEAVEPPPVRAASWRLTSFARPARARVRARVRVRGSFKDQDDLANGFSGAQPVRRLLEVGDI